MAPRLRGGRCHFRSTSYNLAGFHPFSRLSCSMHTLRSKPLMPGWRGSTMSTLAGCSLIRAKKAVLRSKAKGGQRCAIGDRALALLAGDALSSGSRAEDRLRESPLTAAPQKRANGNSASECWAYNFLQGAAIYRGLRCPECKSGPG